jgi:endonuclease/exonuclease/phosphatase family metal-dependent hydrolase
MNKLLPLLTCLGWLVSHLDAAPVKVLTFNLRYMNQGDKQARAWVNRRDAAAGVIRREAADFTGLQEALRPMLDDLKTRLPDYAELGVGRDDGKQQGEYSAILYRKAAWSVEESGTFWLSATPAVPGSRTWGNQIPRICTWGRFKNKASGKVVHFFNAHFDHISQPSREQAAALIIQRIAALGAGAPVIFTGDLNATPDNPAIAALTQGPPRLIDAWKTLNPTLPATESGTFQEFSTKRDGPRIDYIFATTAFTPVAAAILHDAPDGNPPSDHFPVCATLELKE